MKLLVVSHSCATPINQQLYSEVRSQTGWKITIVVPDNWRDEYGQTLRATRWPSFEGDVLGIPVYRPGKIILHAYKASFRKLIQRVNPDVIYVNHEPYAVATAQVYLGNRMSGNRPIGFYSCQNLHKRYPPPFSWTERYILRNSNFACPISQNVDDVLKRKGLAAPSHIVPLNIDTTLYKRDATSVNNFRTLIAPSDRVVIGFVGRFVESKGLRTLLAAASLAREVDYHLVFVGAGPMEGELRQLVTEHRLENRVTFHGFIPHDQIPTLFSSLDILILPSETQTNWKEQFGRVLLEAMACGVAVIGSDSGEIPILIRDTGGGVVFAERDAGSLANAIRTLVQDAALRSALATRGQQSVIQRYSLNAAARALVNAIEPHLTN